MNAEVWKRPDVAAAFLDERSVILPDRERQLTVLLRLLCAVSPPVRRLLDLGAGNAILLAAALEAFPEASGVALDFSPLMLDKARERLQSFAPRATVVEADLATPDWLRVVTGPLDAVVSGFAIHHLPHQRKRALYAEIFGLLRDGGVFVNCEHVSSATPRVERFFDEAMSEHRWQKQRERGEDVTLEAVLHDYLTRPDLAANILAPVEEQCGWLRAIGFVDVDCYWKFFELAICGGFR